MESLAAMSNVLEPHKQQEVLALGRLGWTLTRIARATGVHRVTVGEYRRAAGIPIRGPGRPGEGPPKPAISEEVSTDSAATPSASACEPYRELIETALTRGRNAMAIWQDLIEDHRFGSCEPTRQHLARCSALHYNCSARTGGSLMDDQITVRLPTPLGRTLRRTSRRLGRRPSHIVRMALEAFLQEAPSADGKRAERVEHLIGSLSSGIPDLAERHREYVLASLKHAR
jgi:hypothetical protein